MTSFGIDRVLLFVGLLLIAGCVTTVQRIEPDWIVVSSPRFEILSSMDSEDTVELARNLERFHALVYKLTTARQGESMIPTRIFVFSQGNQYSGSPNPISAGFFRAGMRENTIVLSGRTLRWMANSIVLHEYVHFVVRNASTTTYPIWYDEGFAELLSTASVHKDQIAIGLIPRVRYGDLVRGKWLPMSRVISGRHYGEFSRYELSMFYAQSWALVHYLTLERGKGSDMVRDLRSYLLRVAQGVPAALAFTGAFGISPEDVQRRLRSLLDQFPKEEHPWRVVGIPISGLEYDRTEPTTRIPAREEVALRLGQLHLASGDYMVAEASFIQALELNPANARANAGLGDALKFQQRWHEAAPFFLNAVRIDPNDALNHLDLSQYYYDLAFQRDQYDERPALLGKALAACLRSRAIDSSMPEVLAQLGRIRLAIGDEPAEGVALLLQAFEDLPSSPQIRDLLAEAYVATNQEPLARKLLNRSAAVHSSGDLEESLDEQISEIRKRLRRSQ